MFRTLLLANQCGCTGLAAFGAAYASYRYGREFAFRFGADAVTASIWPAAGRRLADDRNGRGVEDSPRRSPIGRWEAWLAFVFGICLSLMANISSALALSLLQVTVVACARSCFAAGG
ncbi:hypothetical protein [Amycolatopsis sp. YIM 10]|uniref:hypothetical protein n=1 Tax=Amycolatopsis sp. YIM 10 TaxID=2653857 RepID=UPI0012901B94|nr:hypothetical protein [Amycolatopsis sp. YIM 10]